MSKIKWYDCQINGKRYVLILESICIIEPILKQWNNNKVRYELNVWSIYLSSINSLIWFEYGTETQYEPFTLAENPI